jgi:hypothetical protein
MMLVVGFVKVNIRTPMLGPYLLPLAGSLLEKKSTLCIVMEWRCGGGEERGWGTRQEGERAD